MAGTPHVCLAKDECHEAGACDAGTGLCSDPPKANGATCNDLDGCTQTDTCQLGVCVGSSPVVCTAVDQCHLAGICDPLAGLCSNPTAPEGTACSDTDACTLIDTCQAGSCLGASPVTCLASDACHLAGSCDPATGTCSQPQAPAGSSCSDGSPCNGIETCSAAGACVAGMPPVVDDRNPCTVDGCDPATGSVTHTPIAGCSPGTPPDPSSVAPALDPTVPTSMAEATAFLYGGSDPIQTDVAPGAIDPRQIAVLRGAVRAAGGSALPQVEVSVLGHPEWGRTLSRADGLFDLAVNGGGYLTVQYRREGFLPAQRQLDAPWENFAWLPDVMLVPVDARVTAVAMGAATVQVARGSPVTDGDGSRQATVLFPPGTQAGMRLPNGTSVPLPALQVRATEFTVGPDGPKAMPAELPPTTAYTYAVEVSVDEALAAGATSVEFNQPVPFYVENFLGFPVGGVVPTGFYDRSVGAWVPSDNGRIVKVMSVTAGFADLDIDGDDLAEDESALAALGVTAGERERLAALYGPGTTLWRVPLSHFSAIDHNWPTVCNGCRLPPKPPPEPTQPDDPCPRPQLYASTIECLSQTLGEELPIVGAPFSLVYRSDRSAGFAANRSVKISLTGADVPAPLDGIVLRVEVAGTRQEFEFPPSPYQTFRFTWDGRDAYGRPAHGASQAIVTLAYRYLASYAQPDDSLTQSFGIPPGAAGPFPTSARVPVEWTQRWLVNLSAPSTFAGDVGGWSVSARHAVDPGSGELLTGDGGRHGQGVPLMTTMAGGGMDNPLDGTPANQANLGISMSSLSAGSDGSLYLIPLAYDMVSGVVLKVDRNGILETIAGRGPCDTGDLGDGGPASAACVRPRSVFAASDGSLYLVEAHQLASDASERCTIRRVGVDGRISTVAGGVCGSVDGSDSGDGGPATLARFVDPRSVALGPDGNLHVLDASALRKINQAGNITTVAGGPMAIPNGIPGPARTAAFDSSGQVGLAPDGSIYFNAAYFSDQGYQNSILRISPEGQIEPVVDPVEYGLNRGSGVAIGPDRSVYFTDGRFRVLRVWPDRSSTVVAGVPDQYSAWLWGVNEDGIATQTPLAPSGGLAVTPDGTLYAGEDCHTQSSFFPDARIRRIEPQPMATAGGLVGSSTGEEVYEFDARWHHTRTLDALTGTLRHQFAYDSAGHLASVTDGDGNVTTVERDGTGRPTAIVAPRGQRTLVEVNPDGALARLTNPAGEATALTYYSGGLLATLTGPRGGVARYTYDALGRLTRDEDSAGGFRSLARTEGEREFSVEVGTPLGRTTVHRVESLATAEIRLTDTWPDGTQTQTLVAQDGSRTVTRPDGMVEVVVPGPDPRLGMLAALASRRTETTPSGLTREVRASATAWLADPANVLSVTALTQTETVNGRSFTLSYDAATRTVTERTPTGRTISLVLDARGRPSELRPPGVLPLSLQYDAAGKPSVLAQGARIHGLGYDGLGNPGSLVDPIGRTTRYTYDLAGRLTGEALPGDRVVRYGYDQAGNRTSITPPGRESHGFGYTSTDQLASYSPPALPGAGSSSHGYDLDGDLARVTLPDQSAITIARDMGGRVASTTTARGVTTIAYDAQGRVTTVTAPDLGALSFAHDGSLETGETWSGRVSGTVGWTYDTDFRVATTSVNGEGAVSSRYDADGLLVQAGDLVLSRAVDSGRVVGTSLGSVSTSHSFDAYGDLATSTASARGSGIYSYALGRDLLGRITGKSETIQGVTDAYAYAYDDGGRLLSVSRNGTTTASYAYDPNGNRLQVVRPGGTATGSYDAQDRVIASGGATYAWRPGGDLWTKAAGAEVTTYAYDAFGSLYQVSLPDGRVIEYVVDGLGRRIGKLVDGILVEGFLYDGQLRPVAWLDGAGNVKATFVYGRGRNLPEYMATGGSTYRILADHLGSPRLVVDVTSGSVVQRMDYDEFGNVLADSAPGFQPFGFTGGLHDRDTGLVRLGARDYDAESGRWTAKDPIGFDGGDANLYAYVANDPLNWIDTSGTRIDQSTDPAWQWQSDPCPRDSKPDDPEQPPPRPCPGVCQRPSVTKKAVQATFKWMMDLVGHDWDKDWAREVQESSRLGSAAGPRG